MSEWWHYKRQQWHDRRVSGFTQPSRHGARLLKWHRMSTRAGWFASVGPYIARLLPQRDPDGTFWVAEVQHGEEPIHSLTCATRRMAAKQAEATVQLTIDTTLKDNLRPIFDQLREDEEGYGR